MTPILEETLAPPTMAAKGRLGLETAPSAEEQLGKELATSISY